MYFKQLIFAGIAALINFSLNAQTVNGQNNPVSISLPASPTAEAFTRHGQYEVSYNTGTPNISIPIEKIEAGAYILQVSLNNHASGIRVTEEASWVGLGWNIIGGGVISRTVRGRPDGEPTFGYYDFSDEYGGENGFDFSLDDPDDFEVLNQMASGRFDGEPDLYSYNFPGYSGKFYIKRESSAYSVVLLEESNLQASVIMSNIGAFEEPSSFVFTAPDGTIFYFSEQERTISNVWNSQGGGDEYVSAFFISQIKSADSKHINYSYSDETITQDLQIQTTDYVISSCGEPKNPVTQTSFNTRYTKRLDSISGPKKELIFNATTSRSDLNGAKALDSIVVKRGNQTLLTIDIDNAETGSRLYLNGITRKNGNTEPETFTFDYYAKNIPSSSSMAQDYWGFYNGNGNTTLLPEYPGMSSTIPFADREPSEAHAVSGSLKRVNYPTGGFTEYVMESNRHVREVTGSYQPKSSSYAHTNLSVDQIASLGTINVNFEQDVEFYIDLDFVEIYGEPAVIDIQLVSGSEILYSSAVVDNESWKFNNVPNGIYTIKAWNTGGIDIDELELVADYEEYISGSTTVGRVVGGLRVKEIINYDDENEEYTFYKYENSRLLSNLDESDFFFTISEMSGSCFDGTPSFCDYVGRTSSIRSNQPSQIISYGKVTEFKTTTEETGITPINPINTPLPDFEIGRTEYHYIHPSSIGGGGNPFIPIQDLNYTKGQLKSKIVFNQSGNKLNEVINEYHYETTKLDDLQILKVGFILDWWCRPPEDAMGYDELTVHYISPRRGYKRLSSTKEINYDSSNPDISQTITTNYTYFEDSVKIYHPIKIETISPTETTTKYRYYSRSFSSGLNHIEEYPELLVEEVTTRGSGSNEVVIDGFLIEYTDSNPWPDRYYRLELEHPIPPGDLSFTSTIGFSTSNRGSYSRKPDLVLQESYSYTDVGNLSKPTQIRKKGDTYINYQWDETGKLKTAVKYHDNSEDYFSFTDFEVTGGSGTLNPFQGNYSGYFQIGKWGKTVPPNTYILEYWERGNNTITENSSSILTNEVLYFQGDWRYRRVKILVNSLPGSANGEVEIVASNNGINGIDCIRLYPAHSQMTNYLYDYKGSLTEIIDPNGQIQFFKYDDLGRLIEIIDHDHHILKVFDYHYSNN